MPGAGCRGVEVAAGERVLGALNARMILSVFRDLDATHVYELVSASNVISRRMVSLVGFGMSPVSLRARDARRK